MPRRTRPLVAGLGIAAAGLLALAPPARAHPEHDGGFSAADGARDAEQHGENTGHLAPTSDNVELVSRLRLKNVVPEKIADVGVYENYAYLGAWGVATCDNNGVHVVDISNPAAPVEVGFIRSKVGSYPGEGVQVVPIDTPSFKGDILVTNDEKCDQHTGYGGVNLYDVTNPRKPLGLFEGAVDLVHLLALEAVDGGVAGAFAWDAGDRAYVALVDDEEGTDVDILDITKPQAAEADRRVRPRREVPADPAGRAGQPHGGVPARHGGQADRASTRRRAAPGRRARSPVCSRRQGRHHHRPWLLRRLGLRAPLRERQGQARRARHVRGTGGDEPGEDVRLR